MNSLKKIGKILGPGLVTGAADDDPSGIATYSQTGAQFGYGQLWTALFMLPMQVAIQESCARIGAVNGHGLTWAIKQHYSKKVLFLVISLLLIANIINIGADIGAMAAAANLIIPIPFYVLMLFFTVSTLSLEIFVRYKAYSRYLKWLCLSLLAYPLTIFIAHAPWLVILKATFIPHVEFNSQFLFIIVGVLGTTISPYLFFWQASQVVEEQQENHIPKLNGRYYLTSQFMKELRLDNFIGMLMSEIATWSIIVVAAAVLHEHGLIDIKTSADAAKALEPLVHTFPHAGYLAKLIFSIGIIGLGLLAVPVLAGSSAYAFGEALDWEVGLNLKFNRAQGFYGVIVLATLSGLFINFLGVDPIKLLIYSAVINGVIAVPLIFIIALIGKNEAIMGHHKNGLLSNIVIWLTFICMGLASIAMLYSLY
ncbi:MAG: divalent metal cation transporter [Gammaproteobacteria bacterium]|nr:divalent metal cation transporter [Gammaproteobacteria bacterium]